MGFLPRIREIDGRRSRASRSVIGGGTSILPRVAPTIYEFARADDGEYLKVIRGRAAHLRPPGGAARQPRPRPHQGSNRPHRPWTSSGSRSSEELEGRLGQRARLHPSRCSSSTTRRRTRPAARRAPAQPERRQPRVRPFGRAPTSGPAPGRLLRPSTVKITRGDLTPEQMARARRHHARVHRRLRPHHRPAEPGAALGPQRGALRPLDRAARARPRRRRRARDRRRRQLPRHRQLQARHHQFDGPQRGRAGAHRGDERSPTS